MKKTAILCVLLIILNILPAASQGSVNVRVTDDDNGIITISGEAPPDTIVSIMIINPGYSVDDIDLSEDKADSEVVQYFGTVLSQNGLFSKEIKINTKCGGEYTIITRNGDDIISETIFSFYPNKELILSPQEDETTSNNPLLKAYIKDADNVKFYINDVLVKEFISPSANNIYEYKFEENRLGTKYFDVIYTKGNEVKIISEVFKQDETVEYKSGNDLNDEFKISSHGNNKLSYEAKSDGSMYYYLKSAVPDGNSYLNHDIGLIGGRYCMETDIKLNRTTDYVYFEFGFNTKGIESISDGYVTPNLIGTYPKLFDSNGKILGTDKAYSANEWMHLKYVLDFNLHQAELYIDDSISKTQVFPDILQNENAKLYNKFRLKAWNGSVGNASDMGFYLKNTRFYNEGNMPIFTGLYYDGKAADKVISSASKTITFSFDREFDDLLFLSDNVRFIVGGKEIKGTAENTDGKSISFKPEDKLDVFKNAALEIDISQNKIIVPFYIGNSDCVYIAPIMNNLTNGCAVVYTKIINGAKEAKKLKMFLAKYSDNDRKKLCQIGVSDVYIPMGDASVAQVSGADLDCSRVMLWGENLRPLSFFDIHS